MTDLKKKKSQLTHRKGTELHFSLYLPVQEPGGHPMELVDFRSL